MENSGVVSTRQACGLLGVTRQTMFNYRQSGELPFTVINSRLIVYNVEDIERIKRERLSSIRKRQEVQERIRSEREAELPLHD